MPTRSQWLSGAVGICVLATAAPALGQVGTSLAAYTGRNAGGYLGPLLEALETNLHTAVFHTARIAPNDEYLSLELGAMSVPFSEDSERFLATTDGDFRPEQSVMAPTVVGPRQARTVEGENGTRYSFPGGFDLGHLTMGVAQLRLGAFRGTEALFRYLFYDTRDQDVGKFTLFGVGIRHSVSQYFGAGAPIDLAASGMWQRVTLSNSGQPDDVIDANAFNFALHASRDFGALTTYAGLGLSWLLVDVAYVLDPMDEADRIALELDTTADPHMTVGVAYSKSFVTLSGEYNLAQQQALAVGLSFQHTFVQRSGTQ